MSSIHSGVSAIWSTFPFINVPALLALDRQCAGDRHHDQGFTLNAHALVQSSYLFDDAVKIIPPAMLMLVHVTLCVRHAISKKRNIVTNGLLSSGDTLIKPRYGLHFKAVLLCCIYLLLAQALTVLWSMYNKLFHKESELCLPFHALMAPVLQATAWAAMIRPILVSKRQGGLVFPRIVRTWWIVAFLLVVYSLVVDFQLNSGHSRDSRVVPVWMNVASCPGTLFLFAAAVFGKTGVRSTSDLHELLLSPMSAKQTIDINTTPYANAGFVSMATLSWLNPLLSLGARRPLELKDIPMLAPTDCVERSYLRLKRAVNYLKLEDPNESPSLTMGMGIAISFRKEAAWSAVFATINTCASYVGPFLIADFVEYLSGRRRFKHEGLVLACLFLGSKFTECLAQRQWNMGINMLGMHVQTALTAFVYRKGLRLSSRARQSHGGGEIINYMSVDVQRVGDFSLCMHDSWLLPLQIVLALGILYRSVGLAFIATLAATIVSIVVNTPLARLQENYQDHLMSAKDERMRATAECLRNMKILKLQAWEDRYRAKLESMREGEYGWLRKALFAQASVTLIFWGSPAFVSVVTFGTCVLLGIPLTAGRVLSALATFRILQEPLRNFPDLVAMIAQTRVSLDRIASFLGEEELPKNAVSKVDKDLSSIAVEIKDGRFSWDPSSGVPTLSNINVRIVNGMRVAICGKVGAGKTSLLACILGEMPKLYGMVKVCGQTAYVSQSAWIESGNIEENILFGSPMDKIKYKNVLEVCALKKDLTLLSHGDQTLVGERGITLSGGQKQRIQLARAVYKDADIYLLDDPFSAVDAHTGSELFKECLLAALAGKTVLFVTHQVEFLPAADLILVLRDGEIIQAGKYEELLQAGTAFDTLVSAHNEAIESMDVTKSVIDNGYESEKPTSITHAEEEPPTNLEIEKVLLLKSDKQVGASSQLNVGVEQKKSVAKEMKRKQLVKEEEREKGRVSWHVYWSYMAAAYKGLLIPIIVLAQLAFQALQISSNWWMAWASSPAGGHQSRADSVHMISVYTGLAFASAFFVFLRAFFAAILGLKAAQVLFLRMNRCVFSAPMSFFDSTPTGRILNRASSDQTVVDLDISFRLGGYISTTIQLLAVIGVMCQVTWQVLWLFIPVAGICLWLQRYNMASARELTRLYGIQKSPIIHHFGESITGASTIRGFNQQARYIEANLALVDSYIRPFFHSFSAIEWLSLRMELLSTCVFAFTMVILVSFPVGNTDPTMAGLAVTYGLNLNARLSRWILSLCRLENKIISVERVQQYTCLPKEAAAIIPNSRPPSDWPTFGTIEFHNLKVRYAAHLPLVLHGITCCFPGGKKVGIVGRTGSGKSTLTQGLFRIVEPSEGQILIDGLDIGSIGLHDLRSQLSIIPQDPTLFEGTIRANLDPLEEHSDAEIWAALDKCQLGDMMRSKELKLDTLVIENGENWSVGQRQLVCLGRAILRHTRIFVLDEATASVDTATDSVIQRTIRTELKSCTVITIAHRIPTVIDSDCVMVLSNGRVLEFDTPTSLLEETSSAFVKLVTEYMLRSSNIPESG